MVKCIYAIIDNRKKLPIQDENYKSSMMEYLYETYGEVKCPETGRYWFSQASDWCVAGRCIGDVLEAKDQDGNIVFRIEIVAN